MAIDFGVADPAVQGAMQQTTSDPAVIEQRKGGWRAWLQQMNNPNTRAALMQTGIGMMKSPGYGQNGWDTASQALSSGVSTLQNLRERDRILELAAAERAKKDTQQGVENTRADRSVAVGESNAQTASRAADANIANSQADNARGDKTLTETERHNKAMEGVYGRNADANNTRANNVGTHTAAEIEKINRLKKYYMDKEGLDELSADKKAMDYVSTAKGKSPRQLVIEAYQKKVSQWMENQFDPTAQPTPEQVDKFKKDAISEVRLAEEAGQEISNNSGTINRPGTTPSTPPGSPAVPGTTPASSPSGMAPAPGTMPRVAIPGQKDALTERQINIWKSAGGTPQQINALLTKQGIDPKTYGY